MEPSVARDLDLTDDLEMTLSLTVTRSWAMSRSLRLRYGAAARRISNASSVVHRFWLMMMPRAWSMMRAALKVVRAEVVQHSPTQRGPKIRAVPGSIDIARRPRWRYS
jgi:hypothetical protein